MAKKKDRSKKTARPGRTKLSYLERPAHQPTRSEWSRAIKQLARDLVAEQSRSSAITHAECEEVLPWYISDERQGKNVRQLYPAIWEHLQNCIICTDSYELLNRPTDQRLAKQTVERALMRRLPFLDPKPYETWFRCQEPQLLGRRLRTTFLFNPVHVQNLLSGPSLDGTRRVISTEGRFLLLNDQARVGEQELEVQALLMPSARSPGQFQMQLTVVAPEPLKTNLRARLYWQAQEFTLDLSAGKTTFENLAPPDLDASYQDIPSSEFRLVVEAATNEPDWTN